MTQKENLIIQKWLILTVLVIGLAIIGKVIFSYNNSSNKEHSNNQITATSIPTPTTYYYSTNLKDPKIRIQDPLDNSGQFKIYTNENNLFSFKYPSSWTRIVVEIYGDSMIEEFFEDGTEPELHDADGVGNDAFYLNTIKDSQSLAQIKNTYGGKYIQDVTIAGHPGLKSGSTYYLKPSSDTQIFMITRYTDRIDYETILDSFSFTSK